jgi:hypothetical protein
VRLPYAFAQDAIEFYTRKLARTEAAVQEWREKSEFNKAENYGFASLAAVPYAHIVAQRLAGKHPKGTTIALAPNPKDIVCEISWTGWCTYRNVYPDTTLFHRFGKISP